ncbi:hypothetical protein [Parasphingorhabdus sp.]|uniref:hypothetical protein n=1 Tax=Parasphingorhabdus sp. TaxID=2709688 RepID=UPI003A94CBB4
MTGLWALPILAAAGAPEIATIPQMLVGTYSNEEQVYFQSDAGKTPPPWLSLKIVEQDGQLLLHEINAYGEDAGPPKPVSFSEANNDATLKVGDCARFFEKNAQGWAISVRQNRMRCQQKYQITKVDEGGISLKFTDGTETLLKRARAAQCWAAVPKKAKKEDGSTDWLFGQKLELHDQGGRVKVGGGETGAEEIILRMRAVHWPPPSTNRPSMVLYVHKPDDPDSAISYSWADIDASRVGLNLRWMQASCTIEGAERSSEMSKTNFRD